MISLADYWMGRDVECRDEINKELIDNALLLLERANRVLQRAEEDGVEPGVDHDAGTVVSSGWRPNAVNEATPNTPRRPVST